MIITEDCKTNKLTLKKNLAYCFEMKD